jgi:hypothetical protein
MHVGAIHSAAEKQAGRTLSYRTVKALLSEGARKQEPQFERTSYGYYRLLDGPSALRNNGL